MANENTTSTIETGDVWRSIWGYDQTNVDFYEVTRVTKTTVTLVRLKQIKALDNDQNGITAPLKGSYDGEPIRRRVKWYEGEPYAKLESYAMAPIARPYKGKPLRYSTYA